MEIAFLGEINIGTLVLPGLAALCGFILGSGIRSSLKIVLVLIVGAFAFGLLTPQNMGDLAAVWATVQPMLNSVTEKFGGSPEPAMLGFGVGFALGLWKG